MMHRWFFAAIGPVLAGMTLAADLPAKDLAAPPEDIVRGVVRLPDVSETAVRSTWAMIPVVLQPSDAGPVWTADLPVDAGSGFSVALLAPGSDRWTIDMTTPAGDSIDASDAMVRRSQGGLGMLSTSPAQRIDVAEPQPGVWSVEVRGDDRADRVDGYLVLHTGNDLTLRSHLSTHQLTLGQSIAIEATLVPNVSTAAPADVVIESAQVTLVDPAGRVDVCAMQHDRDAVLRCALPIRGPGQHSAQVMVTGRHADGQPFVRTSEHMIPVHGDEVTFGAGAVATLLDEVIAVDLDVAYSGDARWRAGLELWGTNAAGDRIPVCWLGGIVEPDEEASSVRLTADRRWLDRAGAGSPFEVRRARLQDPDTNVVLAKRGDALLDLEVAVPDRAKSLPLDGAMLMGRRPRAVSASGNPVPSSTSLAGGHNLMLVHGYCSDGFPFPTGDFSGALEVFVDPDANRSHDEFAQLMLGFGNQMKSFGVVGHSQGGMAALHLFSYYWSGLDWSTGNRLIQSVGAPYQGTALAGNAAVLGDIFGAGCGSTFDMTYDGAALWLAGIPTWARQRVYYYTTSFEDGFFFDYCNLVTDLLLSDPDDGVTEQWAGQLSGANNMGHIEGWCHTEGMRDPPQTQDAGRNSTMNAEANR